MLSDNIGFACRLLELCGGVGSLAGGDFDFIPPLELRLLKSCTLDENPLLSLPREIRREKWPKIKKYLEQLQERAITSNHRKIMLLGEVGAGKSALFVSVLVYHLN
mmetsp:Transcript_8681/g.10736  ORF Transcript_8681/g.10736 Transcript_8681/m.10736 type:complete len:106 (-) Transcript_8681:137-454(-)